MKMSSTMLFGLVAAACAVAVIAVGYLSSKYPDQLGFVQKGYGEGIL